MATELDRICLTLELGFPKNSGWPYIQKNGSSLLRKALAAKLNLDPDSSWERIAEGLTQEKQKKT